MPGVGRWKGRDPGVVREREEELQVLGERGGGLDI